jgi:heme-degrading monooxygenase HmoA
MAVLVNISAVGMDTSNYDEISERLTALLKQQPGFMGHVAYKTPDGMGVGELWESRAQFQKWFDENVRPNVPVELKEEVIELHNVITP